MKPAVGVEVASEQFEVVIALHEDEVGVEKTLENAVPLAEVRGDDNFLIVMVIFIARA